jgi:flavin-binding protein dodecin
MLRSYDAPSRPPLPTGGILLFMSNRTYRVTEIVGTSPEGIDEAVRNGVERAARTLRHLDWFEVTQVRGQVKDGAVEHFQVGMKVGFRLEDD